MHTKNMDLRDLLIQKIHALTEIEKALIKALPKMARAAKNQQLRQGFTDHLAETKNHLKRLEHVHKLLGVKHKKMSVAGIKGIIADGEWVIKHVKPTEARDANLARAAQYAEHYEMAGYISAINWAETLGEIQVGALLSQTLEEEMLADRKLDKVGDKLDKKIM